MTVSKPMKPVVAGVAAVVLASGGYAVGSSSSGSDESSAASVSRPAARQLPGNGHVPPGLGTPVAGAAAQKVAAAALSKYGGTVERVVKLPDGSYVAHVLRSGGEYHVNVSRDFKVTGAQRGGPGAGGPPGAPSRSGAPVD